MNNIYNNLMQIFEQYFNYGIKLVDNSGQAEYIISELIGLQKPLISLWNIQGYETRKMVVCVDLINEEITLVSRYGGLKEGSVKHAFILDRNAVQKVDFIRIMCTLHKAIYTKVISMPSTLRSMKGELLTELADEALFRICLANRFMPTNAEMVKTRKENLSLALDCLARMRPILFSIFNVMGYSERIMLDIMSTYEKEMKLLKKVMESDEKRFKDYN